ncbi:helix-turn-helix domain-containing protein [Chryseobacterium sp. M5A1_1a]
MKQIRKVNNNEKDDYREKEYLRLFNESKKIGFQFGILKAGSALMTVYSREGKNEQVLILGDELKKITHSKKDTAGIISQIYGKSALTFFTLGLDDAGLKDLKTAIRNTEDISNENKRHYFRGTYYENMTAYYSNSKRYGEKKYKDSILYFLNKSLEANKKVTDNGKGISKKEKYRAIAFINIRIAIYYLEEPAVKGNLNKAEQHLLATSKVYENKEYDIEQTEKAMLLNQYSWLYMEKKEYHKSIQYGNQALDLLKQSPNPYNKVDSYEILASDYLGLGDKEKTKFYMDKYTTLKDSIRFMEKNATDTTMKKMVKQVDKKHQENSKKQWVITFLLAVAATITIIIFWRRKNKIHQKKYEELVSKLKNKKEESNLGRSNNEIKSSITIPDETAKALLQKLEKFEVSEKYLKKEVNLTWLANNLNTNTKYLSEIIKTHRGKNFSNYINGLRINYIVYKLYYEPQYREYKISYLAEESGFVTYMVFVTAFKNEHGVTPSYFIEKLKASL